MPRLFRRPVFWLVLLSVLVAGTLGFAMMNGAKARQAQKIAHMAAPDSPYAAIADGKADIEGGVIQVAARAPGVVSQVNVYEGDRVTKGQVLAVQENDNAHLAVQTARADLAQAHAQIATIEVQQTTAHREYERLARLAPNNFVARQQLDQAADAIHAADAQMGLQQASVAAAAARLAQAQYVEELNIIRAPSNGLILRRYANPGAGASTLNVSTMFDLEPDTQRIVRAEITESALPAVTIGQSVELVPESDPSKLFVGQVMRRSGVFGARKLQSDDPAEATDQRVVEVVVSADSAPFLVGQRVLVKFMKAGHAAGGVHAAAVAPKTTPAAKG
jgi:multidrug resistance efflux pump